MSHPARASKVAVEPTTVNRLRTVGATRCLCVSHLSVLTTTPPLFVEMQWGIPEYNALTDVHSSEVARRLLGNKQAVKRLRKAGIVRVAANPSPRPHTQHN